MSLNDAAKNLMLDALPSVLTHISVHDADPGLTGTDELSTAPYARVPITWNAAASGNLDSANQPVIQIAGGDTVVFLGLWMGLTGGTFYGSTEVVNESFGGDGTYTVTDFDISVT